MLDAQRPSSPTECYLQMKAGDTCYAKPSRGIRHGRQLGRDKPFISEMVYPVPDEMQGAYLKS